ncbi:hypothetical protein ANCCEY_00831 [Ancylostoma ceylanicum]|uniref:7TM GPCR serpentine receptor class x (Srx) domain-containing protein n=1 Tax=Ancylostoma ceylanicum TaxID=53326 RepID=A0A0D6M948_9BILA|nr:hypothetical protein ANCCEY_00831 [Ancylostoma ceylanicum]
MVRKASTIVALLTLEASLEEPRLLWIWRKIKVDIEDVQVEAVDGIRLYLFWMRRLFRQGTLLTCYVPTTYLQNVSRHQWSINHKNMHRIAISSVATAFNRVIAVVFPLRYNRICTVKWAANGTIGIIINVHNIFFMYRSKDFSTSFGYLRKARSICNIINLLVFVFYTAPITVFKYLPAGDEVGRIIALIVSPAYVTIMFIQFAVAFSRRAHTGASLLPQDKNRRLFWQDLLTSEIQGFTQELFANDLLWQQFLSGLVDSPWWSFLSWSFMWELAHIGDGLMFLVFDTRMRMSFLRSIKLRSPVPKTVPSID